MKFSIMMAAGIPMACAAAFAGVKSGHGEVELLGGVSAYEPGARVPVAIRLKIDPGWHSYWINPGLGGMPLTAKWTLPEGWTAGELRQPVPKRFLTGDLPGFGYEGEAVFLVDLTPPAGAAGDAELKVSLSWLTCDDSACVPGDAELSLKLPAGEAQPGGGAAAIATAEKKIPKPVNHTTAGVEEKDGKVIMSFKMPGDFDFEGAEAFPATPDVVDPGATIAVKKSEEGWTASAPKDEYATGPVKEYDLVLAGGKLPHPIVVSWRGEGS